LAQQEVSCVTQEFHGLPHSFVDHPTISWITPHFFPLPHSFSVAAQFLFVCCSPRQSKTVRGDLK
jgi:hypothetical protein